LRILIPEAHALGSIACIRSLGQAGHHVLAISHDPQALGFLSKYCAASVLVPADLPKAGFAAWFDDLLNQHQIDLVLPSEGLINSLGSRLADFSSKLPSGGDVHQLRRWMSKYELFQIFEKSNDPALRMNIPTTILLDAGSDWKEKIQSLTLPAFAKFDADPERGLSAHIEKIKSSAELLPSLQKLVAARGRGLVQSFAPGQGVGVFFLRWNGKILLTLMHRRLHEVPHTGGVSSLRETWWHEAMAADALRRIEALDWSGVGMLEYRWNLSDDSFYLMEFNARFWGSLHLALYAGADFPKLLVDAWSQKAVEPQRAMTDVRCRLTFPKEVEYLASLLRDPSVGLGQKAWACLEAVLLTLDPRVHSDLWFKGDRGLYWTALARMPARMFKK
jgi:predicted ATP-grasp superfamily ATP-dependent carboligase